MVQGAFRLSLLKKRFSHGIGVPMKASGDDIRPSNRAPLSCAADSRHGFWARLPPGATIADRDDARHRDGGTGSVTTNGSGRATLVAMVQAGALPAQDGQLMS